MMLVLLDVVSVIISISGVSFLFDHVEKIGPWERNQLLFFVGYMLLVNSIHKCVNSQNFWYLSMYIKTGELDFVLLRPLHSIFTCFFRFFRVASSISVFVTLGVVIYYGQKLNFSVINWLLLGPLVIVSWIFLLTIEMIISTSMFWLKEGIGINFFRIQLQELSQWPEYVYRGPMRTLFLAACPILFTGSAPVHFLFDKSLYDFLVLMLGVLLILFLILHITWNKALRIYNSASS